MHPMLVTAIFRPPTAEVILEARDPDLDYQYRLTFKTKPPGQEDGSLFLVVAPVQSSFAVADSVFATIVISGRSKIDDPEEVQQITAMLQNLIQQLQVTGANAESLGRMTLGS